MKTNSVVNPSRHRSIARIVEAVLTLTIVVLVVAQAVALLGSHLVSGSIGWAIVAVMGIILLAIISALLMILIWRQQKE